MSITKDQFNLLQAIRSKIKELRICMFGQGFNEEQFSHLLNRILIRCGSNFSTKSQNKNTQRSFYAIIEKILKKTKNPCSFMVELLTAIDSERGTFNDDEESSSEVTEMKIGKIKNLKSEDISSKIIKLEENSSSQQQKDKKNRNIERRDEVLTKKSKSDLVQKIRRKKEELTRQRIFRM